MLLNQTIIVYHALCMIECVEHVLQYQRVLEATWKMDIHKFTLGCSFRFIYDAFADFPFFIHGFFCLSPDLSCSNATNIALFIVQDKCLNWRSV